MISATRSNCREPDVILLQLDRPAVVHRVINRLPIGTTVQSDWDAAFRGAAADLKRAHTLSSERFGIRQIPFGSSSQSATRWPSRDVVHSPIKMSHEGKQDSVSSWLTDTYWYVPALYLPALLAINSSEPRIVTVQDQTVWHITSCSNGYVSVSARRTSDLDGATC